MIRVGFDAMGGDYAPDKAIHGLHLFTRNMPEDVQVIVFGNIRKIEQYLEKYGIKVGERVEIHHCEEEITMEDTPLKSVVTKSDSSLVRGMQSLKNREIHVFASAGNSGAVVASALYILGNIKKITRPSFLLQFSRINGKDTVIIDVGGVPDCKPINILEFAIIGTLYMQHICGVKEPKVGLINIGEESTKGSILYKTAHSLLKKCPDINFIGNVESRYILTTEADVLVCDGFTGNIILKMAEGIYNLIAGAEIKVPFFEKLNYELKGGTPVVGVNGNVIVGHGISNEIAFESMLKMCVHYGRVNFAKVISEAIEKIEIYNGVSEV